jgi:hypothetical protein
MAGERDADAATAAKVAEAEKAKAAVTGLPLPPC